MHFLNPSNGPDGRARAVLIAMRAAILIPACYWILLPAIAGLFALREYRQTPTLHCIEIGSVLFAFIGAMLWFISLYLLSARAQVARVVDLDELIKPSLSRLCTFTTLWILILALPIGVLLLPFTSRLMQVLALLLLWGIEFRFCLARPAAVFENLGVFTSLHRSWKLTGIQGVKVWRRRYADYASELVWQLGMVKVLGWILAKFLRDLLYDYGNGQPDAMLTLVSTALAALPLLMLYELVRYQAYREQLQLSSEPEPIDLLGPIPFNQKIEAKAG